MVIHCKKKNCSFFVCLAICGGKERRYHSSSRKVGWESNFEELLGKVDQELSLSIVLKCVRLKDQLSG